jgi:hypothetical protein
MPPSPCGSIELVATSKTPQPHAQACTTLGANIPANKPQPIFTIAAELLFFISKFQNCENAQRRSQG